MAKVQSEFYSTLSRLVDERLHRSHSHLKECFAFWKDRDCPIYASLKVAVGGNHGEAESGTDDREFEYVLREAANAYEYPAEIRELVEMLLAVVLERRDEASESLSAKLDEHGILESARQVLLAPFLLLPAPRKHERSCSPSVDRLRADMQDLVEILLRFSNSYARVEPWVLKEMDSATRSRIQDSWERLGELRSNTEGHCDDLNRSRGLLGEFLAREYDSTRAIVREPTDPVQKLLFPMTLGALEAICKSIPELNSDELLYQGYKTLKHEAARLRWTIPRSLKVSRGNLDSTTNSIRGTARTCLKLNEEGGGRASCPGILPLKMVLSCWKEAAGHFPWLNIILYAPEFEMIWKSIHRPVGWQ